MVPASPSPSPLPLMFALLLAYCLTANPFRRYNVLGRFWRPDWATFREIFRVGFPIGGAVVMETGLFATSTLFMGLIGTAAAGGAPDRAAAGQHRLHGAAGPEPRRHHPRRPRRRVPATGPVRASPAGSPAAWAPRSWPPMAVLFAAVPGPLVGLFLDPATPGGCRRLRLRRRLPAHRRPVPAGRRPAGDRHRQPARAQGHRRADVAGGVRLLGRGLPDLLAAGLPHGARRHRHLDRPRLRPGDRGRW